MQIFRSPSLEETLDAMALAHQVARKMSVWGVPFKFNATQSHTIAVEYTKQALPPKPINESDKAVHHAIGFTSYDDKRLGAAHWMADE